MKNINILKASLLMGVMIAASSCKEETINFLDAAGVPQASDYNIKVDVDQLTNQYTLTLTDKDGQPAKGVYPVWSIYSQTNPTRSTRPVCTGVIIPAGDYDVEVKVGNHNGVSDGVKTASIHIENTLINFTPYINNLTGGESKVWHIDGTQQGHLGCGEPNTDGLNWWSANPGDKGAEGVYDNTMTFTATGATDGTGLYTYDPGTSGTIYCNKDITIEPYNSSNPHDGNDFRAPAELQENMPFSLYAEGADLMLKLPEGTLMGYLPNDELYYEPKFKVLGITRNKLELVCDNGAISWHYILAPMEEVVPPFEGFKYDSEFNLWKDAELTIASLWFANNDWGEIPAPEVTVTNESIKFHTPAEMGSQQWQGQVIISSNIPVSAAETYDFSCFITADSDIKATVKVQKDDDDGISFAGQDQISFSAGGSCYYFSDLPGFDGNLKIAFDFGGNPDMDITISKIVFKNHKDDDGTILPSDEPIDEPEDNFGGFDPSSDYNQWKSANVFLQSTWFADNSWGEIVAPAVDVSNDGITLHAPAEMGGSQWQGQVHVGTDIAVSADQYYDFSCRVYVSEGGKVTVKVQKDGDDNVMFGNMGDQKEVQAGDNIIYFINEPGFDGTLKIAFDFGGLADQDIEITDIVFKNHADNDGTDVPVTWEDSRNLWKGYDVGSIYYATGNDWTGLPDYEYSRTDNGYHVYLPTETMNQWQAQMHIPTDIHTSANNYYDFCITFECSNTIPGLTVKLHPEGDDGTMYMEDRVLCEGYETVTHKWTNMPGIDADVPWVLTLDFGGNPADTEINISDIHFQIH